MALGYSFVRENVSASNIPECSICSDTLEDPRVLPCGHSFCGPPKACLYSMQKSQVITCALCKRGHRLKVEDLQPLFGIREFLQEQQSRGESQPQVVEKKTASEFVPPVCDEGCENLVTFWCKSCEKGVCEDCLETSHDMHSVQSYKKYLREAVKKKLEMFEDQKATFKAKTDVLMEKLTERISNISHKFNYLSLERDELLKQRADLSFVSESWNQLEKFASGSMVCDSETVDRFLNLRTELPDILYLLDCKQTQTDQVVEDAPLAQRRQTKIKAQYFYRSEIRFNVGNARSYTTNDLKWTDALYILGHAIRIGLEKKHNHKKVLELNILLEYYQCVNTTFEPNRISIKMVLSIVRHLKGQTDLPVVSLVLTGQQDSKVKKTSTSLLWAQLLDKTQGFLDKDEKLWLSFTQS